MLLKDEFHLRKIRIFLADHHFIVRKQLAIRLNSELDLDVVGVAATSQETIQNIQMTHPHILLIELLKQILEEQKKRSSRFIYFEGGYYNNSPGRSGCG